MNIIGENIIFIHVIDRSFDVIFDVFQHSDVSNDAICLQPTVIAWVLEIGMKTPYCSLNPNPYGGCIVFDTARDAMMFKLRWL